MFGANLVILAQIYDKLSRGKAEFPISQNGLNDLEGQGQLPLFSIPAKCIPRCMFGANLVILDQLCDELSCMVKFMDRLTDAGNENTPSAWKAQG